MVLCVGDVWKALADPTRRKILSLLKDKDMNAGEIANEFNMTKPSISNHLNILKQADLVDAEKVGQNVNYSLKTSVLQDVLKLISDLSSRGKD
nr:autorepressor SdpR family transcription factor [Ruminococcus sp. 1001270H_150608_F2]